MVVLLGDRAYKVRKCVRLPFVDLSTSAVRLAVSRAEVELNSRYAPDVYLGVHHLAPIGQEDGTGEPVVVMRRMPVARRLTALIAAGDGDRARRCVEDVARRLAAAHMAQPPLHGYGLAATMAALWQAGRDQMLPFEGGILPADQLHEVACLAARYLAGRQGLLDRREADGLVRDGHGDLLADDIFWLDDGARILDCLEFDARLRAGDILADLAFLIMDLEFHGAPDLASLLTRTYARHGIESHPKSLVRHYVAYRAFVRSKVECLRAEQGAAHGGDHARALLALCRTELEAGRIQLVMIGGLPGSGKSTLARAIAAADIPRDWLVLSSDVVRRQLPASAAGRHDAEQPRVGLDVRRYAPSRTAAVYEELRRRAAEALGGGLCVLLDASWIDSGQRALTRTLAREHHADLTEFVCHAPEALSLHRLVHRADAHASEATPEVRRAMAQRTDPWPEAVSLPTDGPVQHAVAAVLRALP